MWPSGGKKDLVIWLKRNRTLRWLWLAQQLTFVWTLAAVWLNWGPGHPAVPLLVIAWTFTLAPGLVLPAIRFLPPRWFQVSDGERVLHERLGVGQFEGLLGITPPAPGRGNCARLAFRAQAARGASAAHAACLAIHLLLAAAVLLRGHPWSAFWVFVPGVLVHFYPVLLQRSILLRLQPLLERNFSPQTANL